MTKFNRYFYFHYSIGRVQILEDRSLRLENVGLEDMGEYSCEADNAVGSIASTGTLIVHGKSGFYIVTNSFVLIIYIQQHLQHLLFVRKHNSLKSAKKQYSSAKQVVFQNQQFFGQSKEIVHLCFPDLNKIVLKLR